MHGRQHPLLPLRPPSCRPPSRPSARYPPVIHPGIHPCTAGAGGALSRIGRHCPQGCAGRPPGDGASAGPHQAWGAEEGGPSSRQPAVCTSGPQTGPPAPELGWKDPQGAFWGQLWGQSSCRPSTDRRPLSSGSLWWSSLVTSTAPCPLGRWQGRGPGHMAALCGSWHRGRGLRLWPTGGPKGAGQRQPAGRVGVPAPTARPRVQARSEVWAPRAPRGWWTLSPHRGRGPWREPGWKRDAPPHPTAQMPSVGAPRGACSPAPGRAQVPAEPGRCPPPSLPSRSEDQGG